MDYGSDAPSKEEAKDPANDRRQPVIRGGPVKRPMSGMRKADSNDQSTISQSTATSKMTSISDIDNFPKAKGLVRKR